MVDTVSKTHPRLKVIDEETKTVTLQKRPVCKTNLGFHDCCSRERRRSDFDEYGVGTVLYFQFLKFMSCQFMVLALLALPSMLFFFYGTDLSDTSFTKVVTAASLGNLGSSNPVCNSAIFDTTSISANRGDPQAIMQLSCPFGELWSLTTFGQLSAYD